MPLSFLVIVSLFLRGYFGTVVRASYVLLRIRSLSVLCLSLEEGVYNDCVPQDMYLPFPPSYRPAPLVFPSRLKAKWYLAHYLFSLSPRPPRFFLLLFSVLTAVRQERWSIIERGFNIRVGRVW